VLPRESLKDLLTQKELSSVDKLLICLAVEPENPKAVKELRAMAVTSGLRAAKKWNISSLLNRVSELAVRTDSGWELTAKGGEYVAKLAGPLMGSPIPKVASSLRSHLVKIANLDTQKFVEEAIACFEARLYRAAVVLSWVGSVAILYDHVAKHHLAQFNAEALKFTVTNKYPWRAARNVNDFSRMKESDFLIILERLSIIGKSVKKQLENCLDLRNACGHPNALQIADHTVSSHVEILILNVLSRF
jgi:hypothetical protein